ncbi:MAG: peptidylprolyl isomerase [Devosia sp.]|uniref:peptidylprolyl isomerase n=1 Tax=Devosia sp. TaxID=1871048 RepID=UPI00262A97E7|nr:peptidylprolyl isomerase [Devosia sp.]MDB5585764.1 peptidylprolyl isomerase [Devosia sp.]
MSNTSKRLAQTVSMLALVLASVAIAPVMAQDAAPAAPAATDAPAAPAAAPVAPKPEDVVATVGDDTITEADLSFASEDLAQELSQMPPAEQRAFLVRVLIDMKVMSKAAKDAGMDSTPLFQQRLDYLKERALRRVYFSDAIANTVTEDAVRAKYAEYVAAFKPAQEIHASHILVKTKEEADAIEAELKAGGDFAAIAKEKSIDPGAANGGDLGFFSKGMMVGPFEDAAFALTDVGQISAPVESQFGWHIIKLEEKRESSAPPIEQIGGQLQQQLLMSTFDGVVAKLMDGVKIDIPDAALAAAVAAQTDPAATESQGDAAPAQ